VLAGLNVDAHPAVELDGIRRSAIGFVAADDVVVCTRIDQDAVSFVAERSNARDVRPNQVSSYEVIVRARIEEVHAWSVCR